MLLVLLFLLKLRIIHRILLKIYLILSILASKSYLLILHCRFTCEESNESYQTEEEATILYCNIRGGSGEENKVNFMNQVRKVRIRMIS